MAEDELRTQVQSLQKDVDSKAATIKHLQNAIEAKTMTIGILQKTNKEGGNLEEHINKTIQGKLDALAKKKDEEIDALRSGGAVAGDNSKLVECQEMLQAALLRENQLKESLKALEQGTSELERRLDEEAQLRQAAENEKTDLMEAVKEAEERLQGQISAFKEHEIESKEMEHLLRENEEKLRAEREEAQRLADERLEKLQSLEKEMQQPSKPDASSSVEASEATASAAMRAEEAEKRAKQAEAEKREYQTKAIELKGSFDAMSRQKEELEEEMQALQEEVRLLQTDKDVQWRAVTEQIDSRVKEMRQSAEAEKDGLLKAEAEQRAKEQARLQTLTKEVDHLRLKTQQQEIELKALRETFGDGDDDKSSTKAEKTPEASEEPTDTKARLRSLKEQSAFAFDEMSKRITEVRAECEDDKKQLKAEFEQKIAERSAQIVEVTNARDSLQTQVETLERTQASLTEQREELLQQSRKKDAELADIERRLEDAESNAEMHEAELEGRITGQKMSAVRILALTVRRASSMSALSTFRQSLPAPDGVAPLSSDGKLRRLSEIREDSCKDDDDKGDSVQDDSTAAGDGEIFEEEEEEEDEDEETYGLNDEGQEEWAEMLRTNTLNALFTGADVVVQNASTAAMDLCGQVGNITQSVDMFPQMYARQLQVLDRTGMGKELRDFVYILRKAVERCQRTAGAIFELCSRNEDVSKNLQNIIRVKGLEMHLKILRSAGQQEILIKLLRNQIVKLRGDYEDVLDQYGDQCAQNSDLEEQRDVAEKKAEELQKKLDELEAAVNAAAEAIPNGGRKSSVKPPTAGETSEATTSATQAPVIEGQTSTPAPAKGKGKKGKPPPPPGAVSTEPAEASVKTETTQLAPEQESSEPAPAKGKGKKGKPPPPPGSTAAQESPTPEAPAPESTGENPPAKGKGKGKKGVPPPPPGAGKGGETPTPAGGETEAPSETGEGAKGKGKKGGPPVKGGPPGKGGEKGGGGGPPPKGKGKSKPVEEKVDPGPQPPPDLQPKKFHWVTTGIKGALYDNSIFKKIADKAAEEKLAEESGGATSSASRRRRKFGVDLDMLTSFFFTTKKAEPSAEELARLAAASKKQQSVSCLDTKNTQGIEIFLNGCGVNIDMVRIYLLKLEESALNIENLEKVIQLYPDPELLGSLRQFAADNDPKVIPWARADTFLLDLMGINNFPKRAECCLTRGTFEEQFRLVENDIKTVRSCLLALANSRGIPAVFGLVVQMGNFLNWGTNKGAQRGFTLDTLSYLARVEGFADKTYTILRFLMDTLEGDKALRDEALHDMELCDSSSKIDFNDMLANLERLNKAVASVHSVVKPKDESDENGLSILEDPPFEGVMRKFASSSQERIDSLRVLADETKEVQIKCLELFCEKKSTKIEEVLKKLADFKKDMENARRENLLAKAKKDKAEKKRKEREEADRLKAEKAQAKAKAREAKAQTSGNEEKPAKATGSEHMKMIKVTDPVKPSMAHSQAAPRQKGESKGESSPSSPEKSRPVLGNDNQAGRMTLGVGTIRPEILRAAVAGPQAGRMTMGVSGKASAANAGRMSLGVPRSTDTHALSREELKILFNLPLSSNKREDS